jgi:hypothetical protein
VWGFRDPSQPISFEFHRVYDQRGRLCRNLSYWVMTWPIITASGDDAPASRWIHYADAHKRLGRRLGFLRFASAPEMRERLPRLLAENRVVIEERPSEKPGWLPAIAAAG